MSQYWPMTEFVAWLRSVTRDHSDRQIAANAGIPTATFNRQISSDSVTPENAVAVAVAYGASPVRALIALGVLDPDDIDTAGVEHALREATDQQLVDEIMRRLEGTGEKPTVFDDPPRLHAADVSSTAPDSGHRRTGPKAMPRDYDDLTVVDPPTTDRKAARTRREK